jgi:hypothetical protein
MQQALEAVFRWSSLAFIDGNCRAIAYAEV